MFDLSFSELLVIAVVAILFIGPKELPVIMRQVGRVFRRISYVRYAMSAQFEQFMRESGLDDIKDQVNFEVQKNRDGTSPLDANMAARQSVVIIEDEASKVKSKPKKKSASKSSKVSVAAGGAKKKTGAAKGIKKSSAKMKASKAPKTKTVSREDAGVSDE